MDEELRNLQLDRLDKRGKSNEQLKRHSLDPNLENKPVDKALYLLTKGDEIQKLSVIQSLPNLIQLDTFATFNRILPKIQHELTHSSSEFHVSTSKMFQLLISNHFKADSSITSTILQGLDARDPVVAGAWLDALIEVITALPIKVVQTEILPVAILKGQCSQSIASRVASCKMIGKIVLHPQIKPLEIKKDILPVVYSLCQDVNYTVRGTICEQIPAISKGLGANMVKNFLLSNLVELSSDDNTNVRAIAVSSVVQVLPYLDKDTKTNTMVPLVINLCNSNKKLEEASSVVLAKEMGLLLSSLEACLLPNQADILIQFYQHLAKRGLDTKDLNIYNVDSSQDVKGREYCASNLPTVMEFTINYSPSNISHIYDIFRSLTIDPCYIVRLTVGGVFHNVARILGSKNQMIKSEFVRLLRDDAEEVLMMLVPHISATLLLFVQYGTLSVERTDAASNEIGKALLKCLAQLLKGNNWRLTTTFLKQLETLPMVFRGDQIHNEFTPQLVRCALIGRTKPVRSQTVRTLLFFLRWNPKLMQRTWLRDHLIHELGENKCCYTRHVFIDMCVHAMELFSNKYFKENFILPLLRLSNDKVSTIRYCFVSLLPKIRRMIHLPQDRKLFQTFEQMVLQLERNERDRDVLEQLVTKTKEMMSPAFQVQTQAQEDQESTQERKMIEMEENVAKGKLTTPVQTQHKPKQSSIVGRPAIAPQTSQVRASSLSREQQRLSLTQSQGQPTRSTNVQRQVHQISSQREIVSDMTFLKQHFYIDAGIDLPIDDKPNESKLSDDFNQLSFDHVNMTDDVKVTMRRKKCERTTKRFSHSEIPTKAAPNSSASSKRHSAICSDTSLSTGILQTANRRSLNVQQSLNSRIPVVLKSIDTNKKEETSNKDVKKSQSGLPVPVRRTSAPTK